MFYRYEIKNNGEEEILYLYLTMAYEFSRELVLRSNDNELARRTKNFIKNNNINYKGGKVYLVIDGLVVKTLDIAYQNNPIEILKESLYYSNEHFLVTIRNNDGSILELPLKEYLLGTLATNYIDDINIEVLNFKIESEYTPMIWLEFLTKFSSFEINNINYEINSSSWNYEGVFYVL